MITGQSLVSYRTVGSVEATDDGDRQRMYHVTVLSNLARGYDKYAGVYSKRGIPESTYPRQFFLLDEASISEGIKKAGRLLDRLGLGGDRLLVIETRVPPSSLRPNTNTGIGHYIDAPEVPISALWYLDPDGRRTPAMLEDAMAHSLSVLHPHLSPYGQLKPRTVSLLPVARGCQARCSFCFSEASISVEQRAGAWSVETVDRLLLAAAARGAERAVITGGGEPGLLPLPRLLELVRACARRFSQKVVLITNGVFLSRLDPREAIAALRQLEEAGLTILSLSRHAADSTRNATIMGLDTRTERVLAAMKQADLRTLKARIVTVLQVGGVDSTSELESHLRWIAHHSVEEVTLKELYVSTSAESVYHSAAANAWSRGHQVPLSLATTFMETRGWTKTGALPWGSPIFEDQLGESSLRVAAYTEPSVLWERSHGLARSWNLLADGNCYASLEDRGSRVDIG